MEKFHPHYAPITSFEHTVGLLSVSKTSSEDCEPLSLDSASEGVGLSVTAEAEPERLPLTGFDCFYPTQLTKRGADDDVDGGREAIN